MGVHPTDRRDRDACAQGSPLGTRPLRAAGYEPCTYDTVESLVQIPPRPETSWQLARQVDLASGTAVTRRSPSTSSSTPMAHHRSAWNATQASDIVSDPAFAQQVEFAASRSLCVRLLVALCANADAWVAKAAVHNGAAPYVVLRPENLEYGAHLERKMSRIDIDTLVSLGLLRDTFPIAVAYMESPIERALVLTDAGRAIFESPERFAAAVERIHVTRVKHRDRHREASRVEADVGPMARVMHARALDLGLRLFECAGSIATASLEALPPELRQVRDILDEARMGAQAYAECRQELVRLSELRLGDVEAEADLSRIDGLGEML